jgi:hypothetical protein
MAFIGWHTGSAGCCCETAKDGNLLIACNEAAGEKRARGLPSAHLASQHSTSAQGEGVGGVRGVSTGHSWAEDC